MAAKVMNTTAAAAANTAAPSLLPQKPIRFVNNTDGPYAKRRRINSACTTCRRRKTRCSGERPHCKTCESNKHDCGGYGVEGENGIQNLLSNIAEKQKDSKALNSALDRKRAREESTSHSSVDDGQVQGSTPPDMNARLQGHTSDSSANTPTQAHPAMIEGNFKKEEDMGVEEAEGSDNAFMTLSIRNRMPYFRYFGPTAIMPGFKQMVVKVRGKRHSTAMTSTEMLESTAGHQSGTPPTDAEPNTPHEIPVYDASEVSPSPLITDLCKTFFSHLGCNFPFLQEERFMRDLEEKQVDSILVDAVCAIAARFSTHPMMTGKDDSVPKHTETIPPSEYGQAFAQRAKSAIADTFACPSVAVVQAALLLAYDEFGASRDSGLWMYLGIAIRMAQDLGMQTLEGLKYEGRNGPTPKSVKTNPPFPGQREESTTRRSSIHSVINEEEDDQDVQEQKAVERERIDTFWAVFFLDRVISSGTGRPVTLRDRDIQICFPSLDEVDRATGWPVPFPPLIRIIHLYGRVTDMLNSIKVVSHVTEDATKQLASMETHLTDIYQGLSPKLHFNAINFQHYVKARQGTNFILLHIWFHTLIVLLHQPTLLKTFEGEIHQLLPNSRELSMSSAKTIADILAFSELIDAKSGLGNPFTSQPIYIAACAFLKETAIYSSPSNPPSRPGTPTLSIENSPEQNISPKSAVDSLSIALAKATSPEKVAADQKRVAKHTLLATAANQNYQRCYRGLQSLETYWAGVKYILTVLDQKCKGVGDPLLYTREEMECALELPRPEPAFTSPGWRRKLSWGTYLTAQTEMGSQRGSISGMSTANRMSPILHPTQGEWSKPPFAVRGTEFSSGTAIGWSLTGTMNSPNTSLAVLYPSASEGRDAGHRKSDPQQMTPSIGSILAQQTSSNMGTPTPSSKYGQTPMSNPGMSPASQSYPHEQPAQQVPRPQAYGSQMGGMHPQAPPSSYPSVQQSNPNISDADLLLNLHSPFSTNAQRPMGNVHQYNMQRGPPHLRQELSSPHSSNYGPMSAGPNGPVTLGEMMIESQDIDVSALGDEMWLEYLPHDMLGYMDQQGMPHGYVPHDSHPHHHPHHHQGMPHDGAGGPQ